MMLLTAIEIYVLFKDYVVKLLETYVLWEELVNVRTPPPPLLNFKKSSLMHDQIWLCITRCA